MTIVAFQEVAEMELERLHEELNQETYRPMPVRRIRIPKKTRRKESARHPGDTRSGMPASAEKPTGTYFRASVQRMQLRIPSGTVDASSDA